MSLYSLKPITQEELERNCTRDSLTQFVEESFLPCRSLVALLIDAGSTISSSGDFPSAKVADVAAVIGTLAFYAENRLEILAQLIEKSSAEQITVYSEGEVFGSLPKAIKIA